MASTCTSETTWTTTFFFLMMPRPPRLTLASWSNCLAIRLPCAALSPDVGDRLRSRTSLSQARGEHRLGEATGSVVVILVVAGADLDHPGVPKVDAARMVRIDHQRTPASLDAGATQRLAGVHCMPGGG